MCEGGYEDAWFGMRNGQCSGICGGASFREKRLTLAERGEMDVLKINDDDDDDVRMKLNRNKIINKYKSNQILCDINTSPFELSTYKII